MIALHLALLIAITTAIHGLVTGVLVLVGARVRHRLQTHSGTYLRFAFVPLSVLVLLFVALVEASLWAWYYVATDHLRTFDEGLYFSLITMTTLGYGDVTLMGGGRLVSGMQAALGIVLFGWTSALIFNAVQMIHKK